MNLSLVRDKRGQGSINMMKKVKIRRNFSLIQLLICLLLLMPMMSESRGDDEEIPENMMAPLTSSFMKLIPQFNPTVYTVQFKTGNYLVNSIPTTK